MYFIQQTFIRYHSVAFFILDVRDKIVNKRVWVSQYNRKLAIKLMWPVLPKEIPKVSWWWISRTTYHLGVEEPQ